METPGAGPSVKELQARLEAAHERLSDHAEVIADLREDRDRWRQQATALLAVQRTGGEPAPQEPAPEQKPKGFWKRLFG